MENLNPNNDADLKKIFIGILTGRMSDGKNPLEQAVAKRFLEIKPTLIERKGQYVYNGNRCEPDQQGWRFIQSNGNAPIEDVLAGKWDAQIEENWHSCASAEHWYMYEKDWGHDQCFDQDEVL